MHNLQQIVQKQRRTGSPHMQAKNWKPWDRSLSFVPSDGGNVTVQHLQTGQDGTGVCMCVHTCVLACVCACMCVCMHVHLHVCMHACMCVIEINVIIIW